MINVKKLDYDIRAAGIPIDGVDSNGKIDFRPETTQEQRDAATQILIMHNPDELSAPEQAQKDAIGNLINLNGRSVKTLDSNSMLTVLYALMAEKGWIGAGDTIRVS